MIIRKEQMSAMKDAAVISFENRMIEHLRNLFPKHHEVLHDSGLLKVVQLGINRAGSYKIDAESPVCHYIDLMFLLGSNFDTDLQLPWAGEILRDADVPNQFVRIDKLYSTALAYLDEVAGPGNAHIKEALFRLRKEVRLVPSTIAYGDFMPYLAARFRDVYPQKCSRIGKECLNQLIQSGVAEALSRGFAGMEGLALYVCLIFALGSGFASDPQFPWAQAVLESQLSETERVSKLFQAARDYMQRWLS